LDAQVSRLLTVFDRIGALGELTDDEST
ncbi:MAG: hypothetical protein QOH79_1963, partial [Acidimicrobiaceae bacterium]